ncbi:MAG: hypothetical protein KGN79_09945 [Acidobacteriota bacterium]|nr:hypothetical protein [Acidobacteriota bacterium]
MYLRRFLTIALGCTALLAVARHAQAADDVKQVLQKLDVAAANFHTFSADFEFDSYVTDPIPDKDVQKGTVYFDRKSDHFQMGLHIDEVNGKSVPKVVVCCQNGAIRMYEKLTNQVTTLTKLSQYENWFGLGFGASGKELAEKWDIRDLGSETLDGVKTEKLELVPKDPAIRKNLPKVTLWMDLDRGISLKQIFDEGAGQYRVSVYFNIKMNHSLPSDAFKLPTDSKTHYIVR